MPGFTFTLKDHHIDSFNREFLVVKLKHKGAQPQVLGEQADTDSSFSYQNGFFAIPSETPMRPERITPKQFVRGPQTAIVVGPPGEEIYTDEHGRVKVQFHWDREGKMDDKSSCWIRVSHLWAGAGWGAVYLPRIGQEVIVDFLEGDPDKPIITGRVYHGANQPPYPLPDEKTKSTIKSDSTIGGGGSNEFRFEDAKGSEEIYTHAQKDQNEVVENNMSTQVGSNQSVSIGKNQSTQIGSNKSTTVGANHNESIGISQSVSVGAVQSFSVGGSQSFSVGGNQSVSVGGGQSITVQKGERKVEVKESNETHKNKADFKHEVKGNYELDVNGNLTIDVKGIVTIKGAIIKLNP